MGVDGTFFYIFSDSEESAIFGKYLLVIDLHITKEIGATLRFF